VKPAHLSSVIFTLVASSLVATALAGSAQAPPAAPKVADKVRLQA